MKNIMWLRIVLTGLAMEFIYGLYITFIRWYEPSLLTSAIALGCLMMIGGYLVARKANSKHLMHGALVGLVGVLFYVVMMTIMKQDAGQISSGFEFWIEDLAKIGGGAMGGYIASKQRKLYELSS